MPGSEIEIAQEYFRSNNSTSKIVALQKKKAKSLFTVIFPWRKGVNLHGFCNDDMKRLLKDWGTRENTPDDYTFPVLTKGMSALTQYEQLRLFVRWVNDWMAKIRKKLDIQRSVTIYVARHTFSTVLKRQVSVQNLSGKPWAIQVFKPLRIIWIALKKK